MKMDTFKNVLIFCVSFFLFAFFFYLYLFLFVSFLSTWEGLSTCFMFKTPLLPLALICSLLPWLKMSQPLCLLAVFEVESSKSWGVEQSQAKPPAPYAPSPSPSSLSNAEHIPTQIPISWYHPFLSPFVLCSVCWQWSVSLLMALSVAVRV